MFVIPIGIVAALLSVLGVMVAVRDLFRVRVGKKKNLPSTSVPDVPTIHPADALAVYTNELQLSLVSLFRNYDNLQKQRFRQLSANAGKQTTEFQEFSKYLVQEAGTSFTGVAAFLTSDLDEAYAMSQELAGNAWYRIIFHSRPVTALQEKLKAIRERQNEIQLELASAIARVEQTSYQRSQEYRAEQEREMLQFYNSIQLQNDFALSLTTTIFRQLRNIVLVLSKEHPPEAELAAVMRGLEEKLSEIISTLKNIASQK